MFKIKILTCIAIPSLLIKMDPENENQVNEVENDNVDGEID